MLLPTPFEWVLLTVGCTVQVKWVNSRATQVHAVYLMIQRKMTQPFFPITKVNCILVIFVGIRNNVYGVSVHGSCIRGSCVHGIIFIRLHTIRGYGRDIMGGVENQLWARRGCHWALRQNEKQRRWGRPQSCWSARL